MFRYQNFFQVSLTNNKRRGKISSLPASISNVRTSLEKQENMEKFPFGLTSSKPGPMLLMVAATAVKFVIRSKSSNAMRNTDPEKISTNTIKKILVERTTS